MIQQEIHVDPELYKNIITEFYRDIKEKDDEPFCCDSIGDDIDRHG